jgi:hypothetical protein
MVVDRIAEHWTESEEKVKEILRDTEDGAEEDCGGAHPQEWKIHHWLR